MTRLRKLMDYFEHDTQIRDILITGGDALMSRNATLRNILDAVCKMASANGRPTCPVPTARSMRNCNVSVWGRACRCTCRCVWTTNCWTSCAISGRKPQRRASPNFSCRRISSRLWRSRPSRGRPSGGYCLPDGRSRTSWSTTWRLRAGGIRQNCGRC